MNIEKIPYELTTSSTIFRHDYTVIIGTEQYDFFVLEMRFKETSTIELWVGEYSYGEIQLMFGIKDDIQGNELRTKYLYTDLDLLEHYFRIYINEVIYK